MVVKFYTAIKCCYAAEFWCSCGEFSTAILDECNALEDGDSSMR